MNVAELQTRGLRLRRSGGTLELYFPALRTPEVALPLAVFGAVACVLSAFGAAILLAAALEGPAGAITAILLGSLLVPFALAGAALFAQALYMLFNALEVRIDRSGIATRRLVLGMPVRLRSLARADCDAIEPLIAARHQSLFSAQALYQLVARDNRRGVRLVIAESLRGAEQMTQLKNLIENALQTG